MAQGSTSTLLDDARSHSGRITGSRSVLGIQHLHEAVGWGLGVDAVELLLNGDVGHGLVGEAPCQCSRETGSQAVLLQVPPIDLEYAGDS